MTSALIFALCFSVSAAVPGTAAGNYYYTDIVTYLWGTPVNSINIGGVTLIGAEAMRDFGYNVIWDGGARTLTISMDHFSPLWTWEFNGGFGTALNKGFSLEFANISAGGETEFSLTEASGGHESAGRVVLSDKSLSLIIYMDIAEKCHTLRATDTATIFLFMTCR